MCWGGLRSLGALGVPGPARPSSVDLLLFPGGGGDGAVGIHDELGAPHHHGQEEEAQEGHEGHGEALVHVDGRRHRGAVHAGGPQVRGCRGHPCGAKTGLHTLRCVRCNERARAWLTPCKMDTDGGEKQQDRRKKKTLRPPLNTGECPQVCGTSSQLRQAEAEDGQTDHENKLELICVFKLTGKLACEKGFSPHPPGSSSVEKGDHIF
ncbi:uncharacterized protein LOC113488655 [Athene cunicularia]|uniref:uncharacterized protein LOC113488655 n=1 Tax=Athene cunicularia TaxID=194338 RepID=UPI000EF6DD54|nr:uncharacterized protein LOC113488655 [Athene cunicularia]